MYFWRIMPVRYRDQVNISTKYKNTYIIGRLICTSCALIQLVKTSVTRHYSQRSISLYLGVSIWKSSTQNKICNIHKEIHFLKRNHTLISGVFSVSTQITYLSVDSDPWFIMQSLKQGVCYNMWLVKATYPRGLKGFVISKILWLNYIYTMYKYPSSAKSTRCHFDRKLVALWN